MTGGVYYNENDPKVVAWLGELIAQGHLPAGDVDDRSIAEVTADDLAGYVQCHFFAGIGGWPLALRWAGWPDDRPVWTGSCPCQPFSVSGQGRAYRDERHLAPVWLDLIAECRPSAVFGEQVASADGRAWLGALRLVLEGMGYVAGAADLCAAGVGAPHIRQRLYFGAQWIGADRPALAAGMGPGVAGVGDQPERGRGVFGDAARSGRCGHADGAGDAPERVADSPSWIEGDGDLQRSGEHRQRAADGGSKRMADADERQCRGIAEHDRHDIGRQARGRLQGNGEPSGGGEAKRMADIPRKRRDRTATASEPARRRDPETDRATIWPGAHHPGWEDADWLHCTDGKWRPVEPASFPLDHGIPARLVRLRGYGNAIVPQLAAQFVMAMSEAAE